MGGERKKKRGGGKVCTKKEESKVKVSFFPLLFPPGEGKRGRRRGGKCLFFAPLHQ